MAFNRIGGISSFVYSGNSTKNDFSIIFSVDIHKKIIEIARSSKNCGFLSI